MHKIKGVLQPHTLMKSRASISKVLPTNIQGHILQNTIMTTTKVTLIVAYNFTIF